MTRLLVALAVLVCAATACAGARGGQTVTQPPAGAPFIEGTVASLDATGRSIHVKEQTGSNEAVLRISAQTQLLKEFGGGYEPAAFEELREGQTVAVWVTGPVAESFPVQAGADAVLITGG